MFIEINLHATNDIVVNSFLAWLITVYKDIFRTFTFSMQQSVLFTYQHVTTIWRKN